MIGMTRVIAVARLEEAELDVSSPRSILNSINWDFEAESLIGEDRLSAERGAFLAEESPLGKIAIAIAAIEKHFPSCKIEIGEIWEDGIVDDLVEEIKQGDNVNADAIKKLQLFDELRLVIYVDGEPFDYLAKRFNVTPKCLKVKMFPLWIYLDILRELNLARQEFYCICSGNSFFAQVEKIAETFSDSCFVRESLRYSHFQKQGSDLEYVGLIREIIQIKVSISELYVMHTITKDDFWMKFLVSKYGDRVLDYIQAEIDEAEKYAGSLSDFLNDK